MTIRLEIEDRVLILTVIESATAKDFVSLLPLTLTMNDLFGWEKFAHLPRAISSKVCHRPSTIRKSRFAALSSTSRAGLYSSLSYAAIAFSRFSNSTMTTD
jgi:Cyclophilin-like family